LKKETAVKILEDYFVTLFRNNPKNPINLLAFKKTNGVLLNVNGQSVYEVDFDLTVQTSADIWLKGNNQTGYWKEDFSNYSAPPDLYKSGDHFLYDVKAVPRGSVIKFGCKGIMNGTDNGFTLKNWNMKFITNLGIQQVKGQSVFSGSSPAPVAPPIINTPVDLTKFKGVFNYDGKSYDILIDKLAITDETNNISEAQEKILSHVAKVPRMSKPSNSSSINSYSLSTTAILNYSNFSNNPASPKYFAYCNFTISIKDKSKKVLFENSYKLSNYKLLSRGYETMLAASKNLTDNEYVKAFNQFFIGNFPLSGDIIEITETSKKRDAAKMVKINLGRLDGVNDGYQFVISAILPSSDKGDIEVKEIFDSYSLCKAINNEKKILELSSSGNPIKIKTKYKP